MLNYDELENIARLKRLSLKNIEKDYLQDLILFSIYSFIGKELVFKGGTCLYKLYKLGRFSEDLDFTLTKDIDINLANKKLFLYNLKFDFKVFNDKVEKMKWLWEIDIKNLIIGEIPEFKHVKKRLLQLFN